MTSWTKWVSLVVAGMFWLMQATPVAEAHRYLRPSGTDESGGTEDQIRGDTAWVWGPGGEGMTALGRMNLVSMGKEIVSAAFNEGRAFPLVGPGARPIDELVETYAAGYQRRFGEPLPATEKTALKQRLERVKAGVENVLKDEVLPLEIPGIDPQSLPPTLDLVRVVPILDEAGTPALVTQGVSGSPTHHALVAYAGEHAYEGWGEGTTADFLKRLQEVAQQHNKVEKAEIGSLRLIVRSAPHPDYVAEFEDRVSALQTSNQRIEQASKPKNAYLSLAQIEGMLAQGDEGLNALKLKLRHEVSDVLYGKHRDEPRRVEQTVNAVIGRVFDNFQKSQEARRAKQLEERKKTAAKAAEKLATRVQLVPYLMNLGRFFEGGRGPDYVVESIKTKLAEAAQNKQIKDAQVKRFGSYVLLEVHYNGPQRNPNVDRLVVDLVTAALTPQASDKAVAAIPQEDTVEELRQATPEELKELLASLTPREEIVLRRRLGLGVEKGETLGETLEAVARHFSITRERVRQIESKAMGKIRAELAARRERRAVLYSEAYAQELAGKPYLERAKALRIRTGELAFNERGAEPIYVSAVLGGGIAAYNWVVMRLLDEAVQNQLKIEGIREAELKALRREYERYKQARERGDEVLAKDLEFNAANLARQAEQEGPGYVVVVERVADILAGKRDRTAERFVFPTHAPYIHTLVDDQTEWVITKVLPRPGSRLYDVTKAPEDQDPMLTIMVDQIGDGTQDGDSFNPIFVAKQQSGAPAIGEFVAATTQFYLTTSGPKEGTVHRGVIPVTEEEADAGTFAEDSLVRMVSYTYQSFDNGRIPPHSEVHDQVAVSSDVRATRTDELSVHHDLMLLGSFQPAVTAPEAERRADHAVESLGNRYHEIPAAIEVDEEGEPRVDLDGKAIVKLDPLLEASNKQQAVTITDIKADIGATGHQMPYQVYYAVFRASLKVAMQQGVVDSFDVANAGDDNHFILFHHKGVGSQEINDLAWSTFFRAGWVAQQLKYKMYGAMQDFVSKKVQQLIKEGRLHEYANLNDEFIQALEEEFETLPEADRWAAVRQGYDNFMQRKVAGEIAELALPGNVSGLGPGIAEEAVTRRLLEVSRRWSVIGNDKGAAGAFNYPAYWAIRLALLHRTPGLTQEQAERAFLQELVQRMPDVPAAKRQAFAQALISELASYTLEDEEFKRFLKLIEKGLVVETWEVLPHSRAFVDAESEDAQLMALLSAQNVHNIKRIWTKKRAGWINDLTPDEVRQIEQRVEAELPSLRAEYEQRKARLQREVAEWERTKHEKQPKGRPTEIMNPWERAILEQSIDQLVASARPRLVELYKVGEFLGDDYIAAISTEKLAAVTGGEYVGKDDSVEIAIEPFAVLHRAIAKIAIRVNIGNARGSHWVAMRPEGARKRVPAQITREATAMKWSNPIEIALRYELSPDGATKTDSTTGVALAEDMYGGPDYDATRDRVNHFNEMWIASQGGFTPHGPNVDRDIEAAYPARKTRDKIVATGSPFAVPVRAATVTVVEQGTWGPRLLGGADYTLSPQVAEQAADLTAPRWVVVHSSVFTDTNSESAAITQQRIAEQLRLVLRGGASALHFALVVKGAQTQDEAETTAAAIGNALGLSREQFFVVPEAVDTDQLLGLLQARVEGSQVGSVVGERDWVEAVRKETPDPDRVGAFAFDPPSGENQVVDGGKLLIAAVEAAVAGGKLRPEFQAKLDLSQEGAMLLPEVEVFDVASEEAQAVQGLRKTLAANGIKG